MAGCSGKAVVSAGAYSGHVTLGCWPLGLEGVSYWGSQGPQQVNSRAAVAEKLVCTPGTCLPCSCIMSRSLVPPLSSCFWDYKLPSEPVIALTMNVLFHIHFLLD